MGASGGDAMSTLVQIDVNAVQVAGNLARVQRDIKKTMANATKETDRELLRRYRRSTASWSHKPVFEVLTDSTDTTMTLIGGTDDPIWNMLDRGTKRHIIRPRPENKSGVLAFQWGGPGSYRAKTRPNSLDSGPGGASGERVFRRYVRHPGTKPRQWSKIIKREMDVLAVQIMQRHLARMVKK